MQMLKDRLEDYAKDKEKEKDMLLQIIIKKHKDGTLEEGHLRAVINEVFTLGHNAGHCRAEKNVFDERY